ncbi:MAG TPA: hypothetical protein VH374_15470 [Polyangia bacterium]|nr:hypothetical protein [Polyangia bacterium]
MAASGWALAAAAALLLQASPRAHAARAPQIRVVRAEGADPIILEIANRTRAELTAAGLDVTIIDCPRDDARCSGAVPAVDDTPRVVVTTRRYARATVTEVNVAARDAPPLVLRLLVGADAADHDDPATLAVPAATLCVSGRLVDVDRAKPGMQANCVVKEISAIGGEPTTQTVIPACDDNGAKPPCWTVETNPTKCPPAMFPQSLQVTVNWGGNAPAGSGELQYQCAVCAGASDPQCATP